ncbi:phosphoribomutase PRM15 [Saccharomyces eubayanus]|uniref:phosphoribomutase PRM15 n=1 Tax=Saccharomyces eubayanus TaxID=1080349 RepID=UPI0006C612DE|nr:PGM3-like protein [Saccharomyces eubayanus]KOG97607.1 PGM3-like protein [Saccharomyces eubayanus]
MSLQFPDNIPSDLKGPISLWFNQDRNPETIEEVTALCKKSDWDELHKRFDTRIQFGTAGLRSEMQAGFSRMNTLVIIQATQGLATYIKQQFPDNLVVVVGHDHRFHSKEFARATATAFLLKGFKVHYLNPDHEFVHTPLVPFAVDKLKASVGVMITASHNPKMDNGYKVYYSNGCQIIPPHDHAISDSIDMNLEPWADVWNFSEVLDKGLKQGKLMYSREEMLKLYLKEVSKTLVETNPLKFEIKAKPWFVYTPMHGVGFDIFNTIVKKTMSLVEGKDYLCVPEQQNPDPSFPTVGFPNPEEKGALDIGMRLAEEHDINLLVANDPDADRFSIAVKDTQSNRWRQLTGNEIGFLFAFFEFQRYKNMDEEFQQSHPLAMLSSTVSSQMIKRMAEVEGFLYEDTLTGFKWIGNRAITLEKEGYYVPFGFEEAIGYMFPAMEHDKDGISAAVVLLQAYCKWKIDSNLDPIDILENGFKKYGVFKEYNGYYTVPSPLVTNEIFEYIRNVYTPKDVSYPPFIGGEIEVVYYRDLTTGYQSDTPDHKPVLPVDPTSQMITLSGKPSDGNANEYIRLTLRGSGTEPKLKVYIEACANNEKRASYLAKLTWDVLKREWFRPEIMNITTNF